MAASNKKAETSLKNIIKFGSTPKSEQLLQSDIVLVHFNSSTGFLQDIQ